MALSTLSNTPLPSPQDYDWQRMQAKPPTISEGDTVPDVALPCNGEYFISSTSYLHGARVIVFNLPQTFNERSDAILRSYAKVAENVRQLGVKLVCIVPGKLDVVSRYLERRDPSQQIPCVIPDYLTELTWSMGLAKYSTFGTHLEARPASIYLENGVVKWIKTDDQALNPQSFYQELATLLKTNPPLALPSIHSRFVDLPSPLLPPKDYHLKRLERMRPPIQPGEIIPHFQVKLDDGTYLSTKESFQGKVVAFTIPGAYTPICTTKHLPGYVSANADFLALGLDRVVCIAPDKATDMQSWAKEIDPSGLITLFPDQHSELILDRLGLGLNGVYPRGLGSIAQRAALYIEGDHEGFRVKLVVVEEVAMKCGISSAEIFYHTLANFLRTQV